MRKLFILILIFFISSIILNGQTSKIIFYRSYRFKLSLLHPNIYLNDTIVAKMKGKDFKMIEIPSKSVEFYSYLKHHFIMQEVLMSKIKLNLVPNSIYFVKYSLESFNYKSVPKFELLSKDELKELSTNSYLSNKLDEYNIKIEDLNNNCIDTIYSINRKVKLIFNPSIWTLYGQSNGWEAKLATHDNSLTGFINELNTKISEDGVYNFIKTQLNNYVVKSITYKRGEINQIPMIIADAEAVYAGVNYHIVEFICPTDENTFMLMVVSKKTDFDKNQVKIESLINGIMKY